jgi:predicted RNA-binding Zn-ribbon protein involved in translation (DUF1610 family)
MRIAAQLQCVWCGWEGPLEWPDGERPLCPRSGHILTDLYRGPINLEEEHVKTDWTGQRVPDGKTLTEEDCPECGLPTLVGKCYGTRTIDGRSVNFPPIRVDAMPIEAFETMPLFGEHLYPRSIARTHQIYVEHKCPLDLSTTTRGDAQ